MKPVNIAVNTSNPGAVKQDRKRRSSDDRQSGGCVRFGWPHLRQESQV
jgi:hypothetical protein